MIFGGGQFFGGGAVAGADAASALVGSCNAVGGFEDVEVEVAGAGEASQLDVTIFFLGCLFFGAVAGCGFAVEGFVAVSGLGDSDCVAVGAAA